MRANGASTDERGKFSRCAARKAARFPRARRAAAGPAALIVAACIIGYGYGFYPWGFGGFGLGYGYGYGYGGFYDPYGYAGGYYDPFMDPCTGRYAVQIRALRRIVAIGAVGLLDRSLSPTTGSSVRDRA